MSVVEAECLAFFTVHKQPFFLQVILTMVGTQTSPVVLRLTTER